jgi:hypothetical protein
MMFLKYTVVGLITYMIIAGLFTLRISGENISIGFNYSKVGERMIEDVTNLVE